MRANERAALNFIRQYTAANGFPPTGDELSRALLLSRSWSYEILDRLEKDGMITRPHIGGRRVGRHIRLTEAAMKHLEETI